MSRDLSRLDPDRIDTVQRFEKIPQHRRARTESKHTKESERDRARRAKWEAKTYQSNDKRKGR